jgi:hypothetical protein
MATKFSNTLQPSNSTDALFQAWCAFIRDAFLDGGWVQTSDIGQMDFDTVAHPTTTNAKAGYIVVRMDDALAASAPVYVRVDFGSGGAANNPAVWIDIGIGSDGFGAVSGRIFNQGSATQVRTGSASTSLTGVFCHSSVSPSHCAIALFVHATSSFCLLFSIERGRDSAGAETTTEVLYQYCGTADGHLTRLNGLDRTGASTQADEQKGVGLIVSPASWAVWAQDVGFSTITPISLVSDPPLWGSYPGLGYIVTPTNDWTTDAQIVVDRYGKSTTYRRLNVCRPFTLNGVGGQTAQNHVVWQRFE